MSYDVFKVSHFFGLLLMACGLGAICFRDSSKQVGSQSVLIAGICLILLSGLGLIQRGGFQGNFPGWLWVKWICLAALTLLNLVPGRLNTNTKTAWISLGILTIATSVATFFL